MDNLEAEHPLFKRTLSTNQVRIVGKLNMQA